MGNPPPSKIPGYPLNTILISNKLNTYSYLQRYVRSLPHDQIIACQWLYDDWWNWKIWVVDLTFFLHFKKRRWNIYRQLEGSLSSTSWDLCWPGFKKNISSILHAPIEWWKFIPDTYTILDLTLLLLVCANTNYDDRYVWELFVDFV